jgi:hypothetical protein
MVKQQHKYGKCITTKKYKDLVKKLSLHSQHTRSYSSGRYFADIKYLAKRACDPSIRKQAVRAGKIRHRKSPKSKIPYGQWRW